MEDDYNRPKKLANEERLHGYSLMQEKPFSQKAKQTERGEDQVHNGEAQHAGNVGHGWMEFKKVNNT